MKWYYWIPIIGWVIGMIEASNWDEYTEKISFLEALIILFFHLWGLIVCPFVIIYFIQTIFL